MQLRLGALKGLRPYARLTQLAAAYRIDPDSTDDMDESAWKSMVTKKVRAAAARGVNGKLREEGLPSVRWDFQPRLYLQLGGAKARFGVQARWEILRGAHRVHGQPRPEHAQGNTPSCPHCRRPQHGEQPALAEVVHCHALMPAHLRPFWHTVLLKIKEDVAGKARSSHSDLCDYLASLEWKGQTAPTTKAALNFYERLLRHRRQLTDAEEDATWEEAMQQLRRERRTAQEANAAHHQLLPDPELDGHTLLFDGASRGNPGPAGAGAVLKDGTGTVIWAGGEFLGHLSNSVAEYRALILGLKQARMRGIEHLTIYGDSQVVVRQVNGRYAVKKEHLKPLHAEAKELLAQLRAHRLRYIPRRANGEADAQANLAIDHQQFGL